MESLYIISTLKKAKKNIYKFGRHSGSQRKLISRYRTYLTDVIIFYFRPTDNFAFLEKKILLILDDFIIRDIDGVKTEWIQLELSKIIDIIDDLIKIYQDKEIVKQNIEDEIINENGDEDIEMTNKKSNLEIKLQDYIDFCYYTTLDDFDFVTKDIFIDFLERYYDIQYVPWDKIKKIIKDMGFGYDNNHKYQGSIGCITGLKLKDKFVTKDKIITMNNTKLDDRTKTFMELFYEKTDDDKDRISKIDLLNNYETYYELKNTPWFSILHDIKRLGFNYDRRKRINGTQGCVTNLKKKDEINTDNKHDFDQIILLNTQVKSINLDHELKKLDKLNKIYEKNKFPKKQNSIILSIPI